LKPDFSERLARRKLYSHVLHDEAGMTLLAYLLRYPRMDEAGWRAAVLAGCVLLDGKTASPETRILEHQEIAYFPGSQPEPEAELRYRIVYADPDLAVLEKPANLCIHPTGPFFRHTLWHLAGQELGELFFAGRLDRETSGLVLAARSSAMAARLEAMHEAVRKTYLVLVFGNFTVPVRAVGRLCPDPEFGIEKMRRFIPDSAASGPERADAEFFPVLQVEDMTLVRVLLHTGRQHQIRATMYSLGFPVVGDKLYGPDPRLYHRIRTCSLTGEDRMFLRMDHQALHAAGLEFPHPVSGEKMSFRSDPDWPILMR